MKKPSGTSQKWVTGRNEWVAQVSLLRPGLSGEANMDFVRVERSEIHESGAFDLEGLFIRLGTAIDEVGANRVALEANERAEEQFVFRHNVPAACPVLV